MAERERWLSGAGDSLGIENGLGGMVVRSGDVHFPPVSVAIAGPTADPSARPPRGPGRGRGGVWRSVRQTHGLQVWVTAFPRLAARFST